MNLHYLYERLTHKYVDSYKHLDRQRYVCAVRFTPPRQLEPGNGHDDLGVYVRFGRIPANASASAKWRRRIVQAATDTFSNWGCAHEYDCCGCHLTGVRSVTLTGRTLRVVTYYGRNY